MLGALFQRTRHAGRQPPPLVDPWLVVSSLLLLALGLLMVTSASMPIADRLAGQPFYYLYRQGIQIALGLFLGLLVFQVPLATWYRSGPILLITAFILLVLVLIPGIGKEVNGSMRWINLRFANVQVSELAKLFGIIYVAGYLQRHVLELRTSLIAMLRPLFVLGGLGVLLLLEPDFGATTVVLAVALGMVFLAGVNIWQFTLLQVVTLVGMSAILYASPYRRARLISFLDPWQDPFNSGFQLTQSLIAVGRGELLGVGLGASVQKLFYLPEAYTDFLFAIMAEELGLIGVACIILLYMILVGRAFAIGMQAERQSMPFAAYLAYGIGLWFSFQALVNMGVNMGVLPTKGLTLPLMSYGGSSVVVMCMALGLLIRVCVEVRLADPRHGRAEPED